MPDDGLKQAVSWTTFFSFIPDEEVWAAERPKTEAIHTLIILFTMYEWTWSGDEQWANPSRKKINFKFFMLHRMKASATRIRYGLTCCPTLNLWHGRWPIINTLIGKLWRSYSFSPFDLNIVMFCSVVNRHERTLLLPAIRILAGKYSFVTTKEALKRSKRRLLHIAMAFFFPLPPTVVCIQSETKNWQMLADSEESILVFVRVELAWCQCLQENYMHESKCDAKNRKCCRKNRWIQ